MPLIGMAAGTVLFFVGLSSWSMKRRIENMPTSAIRSLAMGLVEIQGTVDKALKEYVKSPFSGKNCVYYRYSVEELKQHGKNSSWVQIKSGQHADPFYVKDKTGSVLVNPKDASISINEDNTFTSGAFRTLPAPVKTFASKNNLNLQSFFGFNRNLRFTESYLAPGDTVFILGTAGDNPHKEEATAHHSVEDIMIQAKKGNPFFISDGDEKAVLGSFALTVYGGMIGGSVLFLVCLGIIFGMVGVL